MNKAENVNKNQSVRGTHDLFGDQVLKFELIENTFKRIAKLSAFAEIRTPIFEYLDVFSKNIGDSTDIITKEMYTFESKGGEVLALRPEGTAAIVRALLSNGLLNSLPLKWFYIGPMFRYERPQKGRQRQFHQIGVEYLGTNSFIADVQCIALAQHFLQELKITNCKLLINSLGSPDTLKKYKKDLVDYFKDNKQNLSDYSLKRLETNPLRILDSKDENDKKIIVDAPKIQSFFSTEDKDFIENVYNALKSLNIDYTVDSSLVRGLDYYSHTVFEIVSDAIGSQSALIAGGRYNNLIEDMNGKDINATTGAFGFAAGVERLALMLNNPISSSPCISLVSTNNSYDIQTLKISNQLSNVNIKNSIILGKNISSKLKSITTKESNCIIIIGDAEHENNKCKVKNLQTKQQEVVDYNDLISYLKKNDIG